MKKILLAMVTLAVLIFVLSGCGVFTQPELGNNWNAKGAAPINTAYGPLEVGTYTNFVLTLEFGGMWDSNKVKSGTVSFESHQVVVNGERIDITPQFSVVDGSYDPTSKLLQLKCTEKGDGTSTITIRGTVEALNQINNGFIYKTHNSTVLSNQIGTFVVNKYN